MSTHYFAGSVLDALTRLVWRDPSHEVCRSLKSTSCFNHNMYKAVCHVYARNLLYFRHNSITFVHTQAYTNYQNFMTKYTDIWTWIQSA